MTIAGMDFPTLTLVMLFYSVIGCVYESSIFSLGEQGKFMDITVNNMRCYTDGYVYGSDDTTYIIFDEIIYVY